MGNFSMVGRISLPKKTDKFNPYTEAESARGTGWISRRLRFNVSAADSRHLLSVDAGTFKDGHGFIYTYGKSTYDETGKRVKDGEALKIPFKERFTDPKINDIADFRKFIIDTEVPAIRKIRTTVYSKMKNKEELTEEELSVLGAKDSKEAESKIKESYEKKKEFISEWDFVDYLHKLLESQKFDGKKFSIIGRREFQYSVDKQRVYESLVPRKIQLVDDEEPESATEDFKLLFGKDSLDLLSEEETGKIFLNGWERTYDSGLKKEISVERHVTIPVKDMNPKKLTRIKQVFSVDGDEIKALRIQVNIINGSPLMKITEDVLSDEQKEDLELGLIEMSDIIREMGGGVRGDRVVELQFVKWLTTTTEDTVYSVDDMAITLDDGDDDDLFAENDDIV